MQIPWVLKAIAFQALRTLPSGAHELLTEKVTRRSGNRSLSSLAGNPNPYVETSSRHATVLRRHIDVERETVVELGAGRDLLNALLLAAQGFARQVCIDREPLARKRYLNGIRSQIPREALEVEEFTDEFLVELQQIGISYLAPLDLGTADLSDGSVGAVISTNTLEHMSPREIRSILRDCHRILRVGGVCSFGIDYSDHYGHTDRTINPYNFLRFSASFWTLFSPPNHYQNRLRHCEFLKIFQDLRFEIVSQDAIKPPDWQETLGRVRIHVEFRRYSPEQLAVTHGWFVLRKAAHS